MCRFFLFLLVLEQHQKKKKSEKLVCSQVQWHPQAHSFSPLITLSSSMFMAKIPGTEPPCTCSSFSKPRATISVYSCGKALAFPINSLDKNVVKSRLFFSELMNLFQEAGSYISHLSAMWWWALRLCIFFGFQRAFAEIMWDVLWWLQAQGTHAPLSESSAERPFCSGEGALVCMTISVLELHCCFFFLIERLTMEEREGSWFFVYFWGDQCILPLPRDAATSGQIATLQLGGWYLTGSPARHGLKVLKSLKILAKLQIPMVVFQLVQSMNTYEVMLIY